MAYIAHITLQASPFRIQGWRCFPNLFKGDSSSLDVHTDHEIRNEAIDDLRLILIGNETRVVRSDNELERKLYSWSTLVEEQEQ